MRSSIPCDVVLLPSQDLMQKTIKASQKLACENGLFRLEDGKVFPHLSLYMLQIKEDALDEAQTLLSTIGKSHRTLYLSATHFGESEGYIDIEYQVKTGLSELQKTVIDALNPIRDGLREKDKGRILEATGITLENLQDYGYKYVGELFRPHITLTRFNEPQEDAENLLPLASKFSGIFSRLGLFEMGDNNTCVREVAVFDLLQ